MKRYLSKFFIIVAVIFNVRYLIWRWGYTLNYEALWFSVPLLLAEMHGFIEATLFFFMVWDPTRRKSLPPLKNRTVDVMVPTYNESVDILRMTLLGCNDISYPHTTYVLDDGNRPEVKQLAQELGCVYLTRKKREHAKAGNLNNALKYSTGEFILTLDADHVPLPAIVDETIGFFADEKVALVQMPQDFYNLCSFQHSTDWKHGYSWHEQELFYSVIQPGKDRWNSAFYCGSTTLIRRKAIEGINGFAMETVTEDIHTALRLQSKGWRSVYYNKTLARGLAPDTLSGFAIQRLRWGIGSMQVWKIDNPITMKGLKPAQRLNYFASMYTYFDGFQKFIYMITPVIILLTGILPIKTDPVSFISHFLPYFLLSVIALSLTMGGFRSMLKVEQYNVIKLANQMKSVIVGLFGKSEYKVTPKGTGEKTDIREIALQLVIAVASAFAIIRGVIFLKGVSHEHGFAYIFAGETYLWAYVASILWGGFYIALTVPVIMTALKKKESRRLYRFDGKFDVAVDYKVMHSEAAGMETRGYLRNITPYGCSITMDEPLLAGQQLNLRIHLPQKEFSDIQAEVRRSSEIKIGDKLKYINGVEFKNVPQQVKDDITRFLYTVAAVKQAEMLQLSSMTRIKG
jgi:cellulose synthase (UDP-forming)